MLMNQKEYFDVIANIKTEIRSAQYRAAVSANKGTPVRLGADGVITPVAEIKEQTIPTELPTLPVLYPEGK